MTDDNDDDDDNNNYKKGHLLSSQQSTIVAANNQNKLTDRRIEESRNQALRGIKHVLKLHKVKQIKLISDPSIVSV